MSDIADYLHPVDPSLKVLFLIGRDISEAHHVIKQRIGPQRSPYAQRSPLVEMSVNLDNTYRLHTAITKLSSITVADLQCWNHASKWSTLEYYCYLQQNSFEYDLPFV